MNTVFQVESEEIFQNLVNEFIISLYTHHRIGTEYDSNVVKQAKQEVQELLVRNDFDINNIAEDIKSKNWDEKKVTYFLKILHLKKSTLLVAVLQDHNSTNGKIITDFNWKIKVILGTSELKTMRYPILQMLFAVYYKGEHKKMVCDISPNLISKLINDLQKNNITDYDSGADSELV